MPWGSMVQCPPGCKECEQAAVTTGVGAQKLVETEEQSAADRAACGQACEANQHCNYLYDPPRCTSTLGLVGERCGLALDEGE